jgi:tetratricopeptide (TPR) repeat protein
MTRTAAALASFLLTVFLLAAQGLAAQGNDARSLYQQGRVAQDREDFLGAIELYRAALRANPDYGQPLAGLAECFFRLEEYEEALTQVTRARKYDQANLDLAVLEGRIRIGLGELGAARALFDSVLAKERNNLEAQFALAELDIASGKRRNAGLKYLETLRVRPDSRQALLALAVLNDSEGDAPEAQRYLELALRYHADDPDVRYAAARFALGQGEAALAVRHLQAALAVRPDFPAAGLLLAQALLSQNRAQEAVSAARALVDGNRNDELAWYLLGLAQERGGDLQSALASLAAASRLSPEDEVARLALENLALQKLEIKDQARQKLALPHLERGKRFEERNMLEKALNEYRRCLRLDPESRDGRLAYAQIYRLLGYPGKYRQELEVLRRLGFQDTTIKDGIEIADGQLWDTVSSQWGLAQYDLERKTYSLAVFGMPETLREVHPFAAENLVEYVKDQLRRFDTVTVPEAEPLVSSFEDAFRRARALGADYFLMVRFEESERSFTAELDQYLGRTGTRVASYRAFRTGNDRVQECVLLTTQQLHAALPAWGRLVSRQFDQGVIDLGSLDGLRADDKLALVKKGKVRLRNDGVGLAWDPGDVLGDFQVGRLDERVGEGRLSSRNFFDLINVGDEAVYQPAVVETPKSEPAAPQGLLRRLYRLLGFPAGH